VSEVANPRVLYSVEEYLGLVARGLLDPDDRVELLEGVVTSMSPQSPRHASAIRRAARELQRPFGDRALVTDQSPYLAASSVPEPDVAVVPGTAEDYDRRHPDRALLVVEVADSSLAQDRLTKSAIYAVAGVPEYWIVNLLDDVVEVLRDPAEGVFASRRVTGPGDVLSPLSAPDATVEVSALLPPR